MNLPLLAQDDLKLQLSGITMKISGQDFTFPDMEVLIMENKSTPSIVIAKQDDITISVSYKIQRMHSRISQHKDSGVRLKMEYTCIKNGKRKKLPVERMFYLNNERKFTENQKFFFKKGISNTVIEIKYNALFSG
jgi:hypothetical protein